MGLITGHIVRAIYNKATEERWLAYTYGCSVRGYHTPDPAKPKRCLTCKAKLK